MKVVDISRSFAPDMLRERCYRLTRRATVVRDTPFSRIYSTRLSKIN